MSSTSSSSLDHNRTQPVQLATGGSTSSKSSSCSSVSSSHRSDERVYNQTTSTSTSIIPSPFPSLYFNPFAHLLQSSCSSNHDKLSASLYDERCCSTSTSPRSPLVIPETTRCSSSTSSTPLNATHDEQEDDENTKPQCLIKQRPCSR